VRSRQIRPHDRRRVWTFVALGIIARRGRVRLHRPGDAAGRPDVRVGLHAEAAGTYLFYALFLSVFGESITAIHLGLLLVNAAIMGLIFLILRKTHSGPAGCLGALAFGVMGSASGFAFWKWATIQSALRITTFGHLWQIHRDLFSFGSVLSMFKALLRQLSTNSSRTFREFSRNSLGSFPKK